jgi:nicotinate-nucleotide adenylyltransferase
VRIGVFGGTFDPPHVGHLLLAADASQALRLDLLIFVPAGAQPFKVDTPPLASGPDRLEMLGLAISGEPKYAVDDAEINREGLSYTVDTLEYLAGRYVGAELFFLLGQDALLGFRQWRKPERILELATLALMMRSGAGDVGEWRKTERLEVVSTRRVEVSSTEVRQRLREKKSIRGFVPESVERLIEARGLYR